MSVLIAALLLQACSSQPLQPWHQVRLDEEFTSKQADEVRTFDDYLALEERLYQQLDQEIYAQVATGPEYRLDRYSAGSLSDPREHDPDWNRSFELNADNARGGVLLLHGMSDSPYSMRALAEALSKAGYQVISMRMPGHGTAPSGLRYTNVDDLAAATRIGMRHLAAELPGKPIHMIGYSTGAASAIAFALDALEGNQGPIPASLVLVSPAIGIHAAAGLANVKGGLAGLPGLGGLAFTQIQPEFDPFRYNSFATNAADIVHRMTRSNAQRVAQRASDNSVVVLPPVLVFKSTVDATVTTDAVVDDLLSQLNAGRHELVLFDINRYLGSYRLLVDDPAPLTDRILEKGPSPFAITLVTNEHAESLQVISRYRPAGSTEVSEKTLPDMAWPAGVISLSHVALPFPPDDPLYGQRPPEDESFVFLGQLGIQGERGLLAVPEEWMFRLRYNPFFEYIETRTLEWLEATGNTP